MSNRMLAAVSMALAVVAAAALRPQAPAEAFQPRFRALVFSKVTNYYHESIPAGVAAIRKLGSEHRFDVVVSDDPAQFTDSQLANFKVVVFNNTNSTAEKGALLDAAQRAAFQKYIRGGGGFVGIHSASGTERDWTWYGDLVGAFFKVHPKIQKLEVKVEDRNHPSTRGLPSRGSARKNRTISSSIRAAACTCSRPSTPPATKATRWGRITRLPGATRSTADDPGIRAWDTRRRPSPTNRCSSSTCSAASSGPRE